VRPNGGVASFSPRVGIEGRTSHGHNVSAVLLGQAISFDPGGENDEVTGLAGVTVSVDVAGGVSAFADAEVHAATTASPISF